MKLDLDQLRELIRLLDESNLTEIEIEHDDDRIRVRRDPTVVTSAAVAPPAPHATPTDKAEAPVASDDAIYVTSPFVGTFYRAPSPQSDRV